MSSSSHRPYSIGATSASLDAESLGMCRSCVVLCQSVVYATRISCRSLFIRKDRSGGSFVTVAKILTQMVDWTVSKST
jgi:hypothetical protein